jgi:hypothetical protein
MFIWKPRLSIDNTETLLDIESQNEIIDRNMDNNYQRSKKIIVLIIFILLIVVLIIKYIEHTRINQIVNDENDKLNIKIFSYYSRFFNNDINKMYCTGEYCDESPHEITCREFDTEDIKWKCDPNIINDMYSLKILEIKCDPKYKNDSIYGCSLIYSLEGESWLKIPIIIISICMAIVLMYVGILIICFSLTVPR